jgi:hypothetical protein
VTEDGGATMLALPGHWPHVLYVADVAPHATVVVKPVVLVANLNA